MLSTKNSKRKSSGGILKSRTNDDHDRDDRREHQRLKIYIQNAEQDDDDVSISSENDFERLKEMYYRDCRSINEGFTRKFQRRNDTPDYDSEDIKCTIFGTSATQDVSHSGPHGVDSSRARNERSSDRTKHYCISPEIKSCPECDRRR